MPGRKKFPPTETPIIVAVKKLLAMQAEQNEKRLADMANYLTGALEQLMMQQGQQMTVQAAIIEYLEELSVRGRHDVFAEVRIKSIVEQNIARMKAEREARDAKLAEEAAKRKEAETLCECCGAPGNTGSMPYGIYCDPCGKDVTHPTGDGSCFVRDDRQHRTRRAGYCEPCGWYPPIDSEGVKTPGHICMEVPADIAPEAPADAPADSPGNP